MSSQTPPSPSELGPLIDALYYRLNERVAGRLAELGFPEVRPAHGKVFENLGEGQRLTELARRAQITKQAMAGLVRDLERHGLVERGPDASDRRARIVRPSVRGRLAIAAAEQALDELYAEWRGVLGDTKFRDLRASLMAVVRRMADPGER